MASDHFFNLGTTNLTEGNNVESNTDESDGALAEEINLTASDKRMLRDWRDGIAEAMWAQYQKVVTDRRRRHAA